MSELYTALHNSQVKKYGSHEPTDNPANQVDGNDPQGIPLETEMRELQYNIELALPHLKKKIIQFIGSRHGEGTSTIAREYAKCCAKHTQQTVLLLQVNGADTYSIWTNNHPTMMDLDVAIQNDHPIEDAIITLDPPRLSFARFTNNLEAREDPSDLNQSTDLWDLIRQRFDLIVIDTPPISVSANGLRLCSKGDGVLLVVEAENTRSLVALHAKNKILRAGGNLLGLVFNQHHHRIPPWLYSRL